MPLLSKASHQPSFSLLSTLLPSKSPSINPANAIASHTHCNNTESESRIENESTAIIMPSQPISQNLFGRNGIKTHNKFGDNVNVNNTGDKTKNDYCNTSSSGTGENHAFINY